MGAPVLAVENLRVAARYRRSETLLVEDVSFSVQPGEFLGIVGESGCGKSLTALSLMGLLPGPVVQATHGSIRHEGRNLLNMRPGEIRKLRGKDVAMIFQDPMSSLNPVQSIGAQIVEAIRLHEDIPASKAWERAVALLREVNIPAPDERARAYPHQLSGGMRQRVMIAIAIANRPKLLIADEPTTALDVTIQAQILQLLDRLRRERGMALVLITHDLGLVAEYADRVAVMYSGRIVEEAPVAELFAAPRHPYTRGLLGSAPPLDVELEELIAIEGQPPAPGAWPSGCRFRPRCPSALPACADWQVELLVQSDRHRSACLRSAEFGDEARAQRPLLIDETTSLRGEDAL